MGFAFYVANFSSYNETYGSVAGAIVALLWLWITNLALLFGAELDAELERGTGAAARASQPRRRCSSRCATRREIQKAADPAGQGRRPCNATIRLAAAGPGDPSDRPFGRR